MRAHGLLFFVRNTRGGAGGGRSRRPGPKDAACVTEPGEGLCHTPCSVPLTRKFRKIHCLQVLKPQSCITAAELWNAAGSMSLPPPTHPKPAQSDQQGHSPHRTRCPPPARDSYNQSKCSQGRAAPDCPALATQTSFRTPEMKTETALMPCVRSPLGYPGSSHGAIVPPRRGARRALRPVPRGRPSHTG